MDSITWSSFRLTVSGLVNLCAKSPNTAMDEALLLCSQILTSGKLPLCPLAHSFSVLHVPDANPDLAPRRAAPRPADSHQPPSPSQLPNPRLHLRPICPSQRASTLSERCTTLCSSLKIGRRGFAPLPRSGQHGSKGDSTDRTGARASQPRLVKAD